MTIVSNLRPKQQSIDQPWSRRRASPEEPLPSAAVPESSRLVPPSKCPVIPAPPATEPIRKIHSEKIESIIGRRWLGWAAVCLILFAAAFFLKYAFDNRWIGELGRVAIGVAAGVSMTVFGFRYHQRGWRVFSQILTGGGIVLLYLSAYAAFGYYHLATQKAAFAYLAILVAEAACPGLPLQRAGNCNHGTAGRFSNAGTPALRSRSIPLTVRLHRRARYRRAGSAQALAGTDRRWPSPALTCCSGFGTTTTIIRGSVVAVMVFQAAVFLIFLSGSRLGRQLVTATSRRSTHRRPRVCC